VSKPTAIRLLLADDHAVVLDGLAALLDYQSDFEVVAKATDGAQLIRLYREHRPDVALIDLRMPGVDGLEAIRSIRSEFPDAKLIVLTTFDGDEDIYRALEAGAQGYLLKDAEREDLFAAIRTVHGGGRHVPAVVAAKLVDRAGAGSALTAREIDVLKRMAAGESNKEIGSALFISEGTAKTHVAAILAKLGARDRTEAVVIAMRRGILRLQ
jgi:two-component system NarL family response regulator